MQREETERDSCWQSHIRVDLQEHEEQVSACSAGMGFGNLGTLRLSSGLAGSMHNLFSSCRVYELAVNQCTTRSARSTTLPQGSFEKLPEQSNFRFCLFITAVRVKIKIRR